MKYMLFISEQTLKCVRYHDKPSSVCDKFCKAQVKHQSINQSSTNHVPVNFFNRLSFCSVLGL